MKILLTGTHFTTAVATIEELKKFQEINLVYVGRKTTREGDSAPSVESTELPKMGVKFISITTGRLQRALTLYTIPSLLKIPVGFIQAFLILLKEKPDVVLSFGGYVGVPIVFWAWAFSIPVVIHEQTLVSGLANKISGLFADKIATSFKSSFDFSKEKMVYTGNPIRKEIIDTKVNRKRVLLPTILVTGGNQGSHVLNLAVEDCLDDLTKKAFIIHQTGDSRFKDFERLERKKSERYEVQKFISDDWAKVLSKTDLVIGRAGINTLSELAYLGIPSLVIPVPYLYKDEQNENARFFQDLGLVKTLPQSRLTGKSLLEETKEMLKNLDKLKKDAGKAREIIVPDAARRLAIQTIILAKFT